MTKRIFSVTFLALSLGFVTPICAGGSVAGTGGATEITQIKNNVEMTLQSTQAVRQSIEMVEQSYLQRLQQLKESLGPYTTEFQKTYAAYQRAQGYQNSLSYMQGDLNSLNSMLQIRQAEYGASNLTWEQWRQREAKLIQEGDASARAKLMANRDILEQSSKSIANMQAIQQQMGTTSGTHGATQLLGAQLTALGGDINGLLKATTITNINQAQQQDAASSEKKQMANIKGIIEMQQEKARQKDREVFNAMKRSAEK